MGNRISRKRATEKRMLKTKFVKYVVETPSPKIGCINIHQFNNGQICTGGDNTVQLRTKETVGSSHADVESGRDQTQCLADVQDLKNGLKNVYAAKENWMHPLPTLENTKHTVEDYYVDLDISLLKNNFNQVEKSPIPLEELFCPFEGKRAPRSVLLTGDCGYGKSTLCLKMVQDWLLDESNYMSSFDIVLFIRLRDTAKTVHKEIFNLCRGAGFEKKPDELYKLLKTVGKRALLILDGYDEANESTKRSVQKIISFKDSDAFMKGTTVLITTRLLKTKDPTSIFQDTDENIVEGETIPKELECCERKTCINSLSKEVQHRYVDRFFKSNPQMAAMLKEKLADINVTLKLSPTTLFIICILRREGYDVSYQVKFWEQYVRLIYIRAMSREKCNLSENELEELFDKLGQLSLEALLQNKLYNEKNDILSVFGTNFDFLMASGLFCETSASSVKDVSKLKIVHKGVLEVLACTYLNKLVQDCEDKNSINAHLLKCIQPTNFCCGLHVIVKPTMLICKIFFQNKSLQAELKISCTNDYQVHLTFDYPSKIDYSYIGQSAKDLTIWHKISLSECLERITKFVDQNLKTAYSSHLIHFPLNQCILINIFFDPELRNIDNCDILNFSDHFVETFTSHSKFVFIDRTLNDNSDNDELSVRELEFWNKIKRANFKRHYDVIEINLPLSMVYKILNHWLLHEHEVSIFVKFLRSREIFFWLLAKEVIAVNVDLHKLQSVPLLITKMNDIPYVTFKRQGFMPQLVEDRFKRWFVYLKVNNN